MAIQNQLECNRVVGCLSQTTSSELLAQCLPASASRPNVTKGVSAIIFAIFDTVVSSYKQYQSRVALTRLTEDQLRDIGLERSHDGFVHRH